MIWTRRLLKPVVSVAWLGLSPAQAWAEPSTAKPVTALPPTTGPQEIVVQGDKAAASPGFRDPSLAGAVITRDRLTAPGLQAQDILRGQPGVMVTEAGGYGAPATASVRGATAADTPIYLSGVRLNDDIGGTADLSMVPLWLIHHVEVYRGNPPIDADRLAPGGAIFFEPLRPTRPMGGVGYYGGSWGTSKGWAFGGSRQGRISYLVGLSADRASNRYPYLNDQGMLLAPSASQRDIRQNADEQTVEGWLLGRAELGKGASLEWVANGIRREQGVPRLALLPSREARQLAGRKLASITLRVPFGAEARTVIEARTSLLNGTVDYNDPLEELALQAAKLHIGDTRFEQSVSARSDLAESFRFRALFNWAREKIDRQPDDIPLGKAQRSFFRLALGSEYKATSLLSVRALVSGECHDTQTTSNSVCDELLPTGRLGMELTLGRTRWYSNVARYARIPTLGELFGASGTVHGNRDLKPELGSTMDLGVRAEFPVSSVLQKAYLDSFVFARWASDLVAYTHTGQGFVKPYNVERARVTGAELLGGLLLFKWARLEVATTLLDPRDTSPSRTTVNDLLPYRSKLVVSPRFRWDWRRPGRTGLSGFGGEFRAIYQSSRYADPAGLAVIGEQTTVDLETHLTWFDGLLTLRGRIADLFDAKRTDIVGYPLPGRSAYLGLEATY